MTLRDNFVAKAISQIGVKESPANSNKTVYGAYTGHNGQPWCGSFVMWCANQVGFKLMPNVVYTPAGVAAFQGKGLWANAATAKPRPGDILFFDFPGGAKVDHVGIVIKDNLDGTVTTVEGNTIPTGKSGDESNGGEVCEKIRAYKKDNKRKLPVYVIGFGTPQWPN